MKLREKKSIIIGTIIAFIIFVVFIVLIFLYIYPNILNIEKLKDDYGQKIIKLNNLEYSGIKYDDFNKVKTVYNSDKSLSIIFDKSYENMIKKLDKNFYEKTLSGSIKANTKFLDNLQKIKKDILIKKNSYSYKQKVKDIYSILPKYSNFIDMDENNNFLTNFKFINYVEKLLNDNNIKTKDNIGIKSIEPIIGEDDIFYIPLSLELNSTKGNLLNFLNYIKSSGQFILEDGNIKILNNRQVSEVYNVKFKKYINNSYNQRLGNESLYDFLSNDGQLGDIIKVSLTLRFYINTISKDVILRDINKIIGNIKTEILYDKDGNILRNKDESPKVKLINYNYSNLLIFVKKLNSNPIINKNLYLKAKVNDIYMYLNDNDLKKNIKNIKKEITKTKDINNIYKRVLKYKEIFKELDKKLYGITINAKLDKILPEIYKPSK